MRRAAHQILEIARRAMHAGFIPVLVLTASLFFLVPTARSQEPDDTIAPPPLKLIPKNEKVRLSAETSPKSRTTLALQMMSDSLVRAETLDSKNKFLDMYHELGTFHAIMDDTLGFLNSQREDSTLKNFKKFEMGLRSFAPRLEVLRRDLPIQYEPYLKSLIKYVQDTREKAIEPFYGNTVVPNVRNN